MMKEKMTMKKRLSCRTRSPVDETVEEYDDEEGPFGATRGPDIPWFNQDVDDHNEVEPEEADVNENSVATDVVGIAVVVAMMALE